MVRLSLWDWRQALFFAVEGGVEKPSSEVGTAIRDGHDELRRNEVKMTERIVCD